MRWHLAWRFFCILSLLAVSAAPGTAAAVTPHTPITAMTCEDGLQTGGAHYRICMPPTWNGDLVVYVHGYVAANRPVGIPEDQMVLPNGSRVDKFVTDLGYAFATTSFRTNGLSIVPAQDDLVDLVGIFTARKGTAHKVLLAGVSEGGLIAALLAERRGDLFAGALAMCGPYGDFRRQIDYIGDFRTLFDWYFPGVIPPSPVDVLASLRDTWETSFYSTTVEPVLADEANSAKLLELLTVAQAPFDTGDSQSRSASAERLLWYNIMGTADANPALQLRVAQEGLVARARFAHFAPFANTVTNTAVTVNVAGSDLFTDVVFPQITPYVNLPLGAYPITVIPTGMMTPVISGTAVISGWLDYTFAAIGDGINQPLELLRLMDDNVTPPSAGTARLRLGHLAPFANTIEGTKVDVCAVGSNTPLLDDIVYKQFGVLSLPAGLQRVYIAAPEPDCALPLVSVPPFVVAAGRIVSAYAVGDLVNLPPTIAAAPALGVTWLYLPTVRAD